MKTQQYIFFFGALLLLISSCKEDKIVSSTRVYGHVFNKATQAPAPGIKLEVKLGNRDFDIFGGNTYNLLGYTDSLGNYDFILEINEDRTYSLQMRDTSTVCPQFWGVARDIDETKKEQCFDFGYEPRQCD